MARWHNFTTHEEWGEFVQNPNTSSAVCKLMKSSQIVETIFALLMFIIQTEKKTLKGLPVFPVKMLYILDEDLISMNMLN